MNIIKAIKYWYYYWRFRFLIWKLNPTVKNSSRSLAVAFIPEIKNAITAFSVSIKHCDFCGVDTLDDEFGRCCVCGNRRP